MWRLFTFIFIVLGVLRACKSPSVRDSEFGLRNRKATADKPANENFCQSNPEVNLVGKRKITIEIITALSVAGTLIASIAMAWISQNTLRAQSAAWVSIEKVTVQADKNSNGYNGEIIVDLKNYSSWPALNVSVGINLSGEAEKLDTEMEPVTIMPQGEFGFKYLFKQRFTPGRFERIRSGISSLKIKLKYSDVYNREYILYQERRVGATGAMQLIFSRVEAPD